MLHLVLADTALELLPKSLKKQPSVVKNIKRFGNSAKLLDTTLHHSEMANLPNHIKRGRPDILQHFLLDALGSPANHAGHLKIYFHIGNALYRVSSDMRCPRDYRRFKGLMVQLLELGHIPKISPYFIEQMNNRPADWMAQFSPQNIWKFTSCGEPGSLPTITNTIKNSPDDSVVVIGGFQKGKFSKSIMNWPGKSVSLPFGGLDSWIVVNRVITLYEHALSMY